MICQRCGYCCIKCCVILPDGTAKDSDEECKFLVWEGTKATCTIHGKRWKAVDSQGNVHRGTWKHTPCGQHGQMERTPDGPCRIGVYVTKKGGFYNG
jgi:hypothetical protein